jgi:hypothetical protein
LLEAENRISIFIATNLEDAQPERDALQHIVLPALRERFEEEHLLVEMIDPYLRISSEEQAQPNLIIKTCLDGVETCRFFVGIIGESYGRTLHGIPEDAIEAHPWVRSFAGRSLLDVLVMAINRTQTAGKAFFYLRGPSFVDSEADDRKSILKESPDRGQIAGDGKHRIDELKRAIRTSGVHFREDYPSVQALADVIIDDLERAIRREFEPIAPSPAQTASIRISETRSVGLAPESSSESATEGPKHPQEPSLPIDENVQFTVYRPKVIEPVKWYTLLAFAHLSERRPGSPEDEPDPIEQVAEEARQILGKKIAGYKETSQESEQPIPARGSITFVPDINGVEFNPPSRSFLWEEAVHREEFRLRATPELDGKIARGRLTVYLGCVVVGEASLSIRVDSSQARRLETASVVSTSTRPFQKIFASYSHKDHAIVEQFASLIETLRFDFIRDWTHLRSGETWDERLKEFIRAADVFLLYWSRNSMYSPEVKKEWEYALSLDRPEFIRPLYWEDPLPRDAASDLPPRELEELHFKPLYQFPKRRLKSRSSVALKKYEGSQHRENPLPRDSASDLPARELEEVHFKPLYEPSKRPLKSRPSAALEKYERSRASVSASEPGSANASTPVRTWRSLIRRTILVAGLGCLMMGFAAVYLFSSYTFKGETPPIADAPPDANDTGGVGTTDQHSPVPAPAFVVKPGKLVSIPVQVPDVSPGAHLVGTFTTTGGRANDIEVFVIDRGALSNLKDGTPFTAIYASGRVTSGSIDVALPPGNYYLVFSNVFSLISTKAISTKIELHE